MNKISVILLLLKLGYELLRSDSFSLAFSIPSEGLMVCTPLHIETQPVLYRIHSPINQNPNLKLNHDLTGL
jgi:hypothetical protein